MTKKNSNSCNQEQEDTALIPPGAAYPGAVLMLIGFVAFYLSGRVNPGVFGWQSYGAIVLLVVGGLLWFTSGMDKIQLIEWFRSAFVALLLALMIRWAIAEPYRIPSGSMEPTLHGDPRFGRGDRVFVNKWVYGLRYPFLNKRIWYGSEPKRWELVVFKSVEEDAVHKTLVKRIVGMPGEHVQIRNQRVYINGNPLELPPDMPQDLAFTAPINAPYGVQEGSVFSEIPEGHYLLLGDNSAHSRDGRYFGWVPNEHLVGRVSCVWWPPPRWRDFTGFSGTWWWRSALGLLLLGIFLRLFCIRLCSVQLSETENRTDHLVISFLHYGVHLPLLKTMLYPWRAPERGELVLFSVDDKKENNTFLMVGRVAGLPGEQVVFANEQLTVNGEPLSLPVPAPQSYTTSHRDALYGRGKSKEYIQVPENHYFILSDGDCSDATPHDSRMLGWIPQQHVLGRAVLCWWPISRWGRR